MEAAQQRSVAASRLSVGSLSAPGLFVAALAFAVIGFLGVRGGGTDFLVRAEAGVIVWWAVLLVCVTPWARRVTPVGWAAAAALALFTLWSAIGLPASESAERTFAEVQKLALYLGILVLGLFAQSWAPARFTVFGLALGVGLIASLAVLSRMYPASFPVNELGEFLPSIARRLAYPLNYWNALATMLAIGVPLFLAAATSARSLAAQGLAAAALPVTGLAIFLAVSRAGTGVLVLGILVFLVLTPRRLWALGTLVVGGVGAAILIASAVDRPAVRAGTLTDAARDQGAELFWVAVLVCAGVALVQAGMGLLARHVERPRLLRVPPRALLAGLAAVLVIGAVAGIAAGGPDRAQSAWADFKAPPGEPGTIDEGDVLKRLQSGAGNGRYQYWQVALDASREHRLAGTGAGTFELWWAPRATIGGKIRNAHSLYLETAAEVGLVGVGLLGAFVLIALAGGTLRLLRAAPEARVPLAAAVAGMAVFFAHAALDWQWDLPAVPAALLLLVAVALAGGTRSSWAPPARLGGAARTGVFVSALVALGLTGVLLATTNELRASQAAAGRTELGAALQAADTAAKLQPYAAGPLLQRGLVLEAAGELEAARAAVTAAVKKEPTSWQLWLTRSRLEVRTDATREALRSFRRARALNPRSPIFAQYD